MPGLNSAAGVNVMDDTDTQSYTVPGGGPGEHDLGSHREPAVANHADVPSMPHNAL